ncbi:hypothetical protein CBL_08569 [Carabus blaptoides fortunei]
MSNDMYAKIQNKIDCGISDTTWTSLVKARLARENGEVDNEGIPLIAKNWNRPSTPMESDIIVEGFLRSEQMHGIKYTQLIAEGDSSVHRKLLEARHYGNNLLVEKIEYSSNGKYVSKPIRDLLHGSIKRLRAAVENATKYRRTKSVSIMSACADLKTGFLNGPSHKMLGVPHMMMDDTGVPECFHQHKTQFHVVRRVEWIMLDYLPCILNWALYHMQEALGRIV